ncbi:MULTISPECIES: hydroxymethylbilane synthase [Clostridia]|jgi:hydroxymethylbilane synthase|uniref:hydroxymethylbilane synthase n=1 Tax=Clostridia TaxID=186801 RepID=UPI0018A8F074|nr:hydroxymethylbilane synthase [Clostridium sp. 1001270J_160509_D11]
MKLVVGTRGSNLALVQTNWVVEQLKKNNPNIEFEIKIIKTKGDLIKDLPLDKIGDKGLFVKEIEKSLLDKEIDMAVHSMKDMPSYLPEGLKFAHSPRREDPRDALIFREGYKTLEDLPQGAKIGTGSKRRKYQLLKHRPDLEIVPIRGNIETRIKKIETENLDGVVLAASGLRRAGLEEKIDYYIPTDIMLPAPAQGILALEIREDDKETEKIIDSIKDNITKVQIDAERGFLIGVNGSCHIPMGAYCEVDGEKITLTGLYGDGDGKKIVIQSKEGTLADAQKIGYELAKSVLKEYEK